jgi:hypothetical protein
MVRRDLPPFVTSSLLPFTRVADTIVKVPQMAESITEGTLKQFSKREHPDYNPSSSVLF